MYQENFLYTADMLSRAPLPHLESDCHNETSTKEQALGVISQLPANKDSLKLYSQAQANDTLCTQLIQYFMKAGHLDINLKVIYYNFGRYTVSLHFVTVYFSMDHILLFQSHCSRRH